eukprot:m.224517 g.224517  ORF g.224517 m.224517 type:complete len:68 (-) comp16483_c0_seq1:46-249(-)
MNETHSPSLSYHSPPSPSSSPRVLARQCQSLDETSSTLPLSQPLRLPLLVVFLMFVCVLLCAWVSLV